MTLRYSPRRAFRFRCLHIKPRDVPNHIKRPSYALSTILGDVDAQRDAEDKNGKIPLGGEAEQKLKSAAVLAKKVRDFAGSLVKSRHVFIPPSSRPLEDGDLVNVDVTVFLNGYHGDTSQTWLVGDVDLPGRLLCSITNEALEAGISVCGPGQPFKNIGRAIHTIIEPQYQSGHGIGSVFHRKPWILNHFKLILQPAIIQGRHPTSWIFPDGWTASTENCARSAQAEHMVLITEEGVEILTR
ncbi:hypothetical protein D9757_008709 [Collybiopsis confluens]|uniref:Peptidase M24 domain-containing protein n=1 Tax=Collybiopsis confluens TaxID=2823264 RepID=A0A8H5M323_9AGAR|nr:hypothetical protein D9757_008709 [Collybiopsis confluens]